MATTTAVSTTTVPTTVPSDDTSISSEKSVYRAYAKFDEKGEITKLQAKSETANQMSWKKAEEAGFQQLNEVEFIKYTVKTMAGFETLVPDLAQRMYITNAGIAYVQNAKANAKTVEMQEDGITPVYNAQTIDLIDSLREPPSKRSLSDEEKLMRTVSTMNLNDKQIADLLRMIAKRHDVVEEVEVGLVPEVEEGAEA